ncbi:MAG: hypothetical protein V7L30_12090 [Nostoc sp.]|uniref:hypothetical protein n=1 Tax=Nostoc sp. TaxID=1180 RepID=UPI002FF9A6F9
MPDHIPSINLEVLKVWLQYCSGKAFLTRNWVWLCLRKTSIRDFQLKKYSIVVCAEEAEEVEEAEEAEEKESATMKMG